jgi:hypothetical protein
MRGRMIPRIFTDTMTKAMIEATKGGWMDRTGL